MISDRLERLYLSDERLPFILGFDRAKGVHGSFRTISIDEQNCPISQEELTERIHENKSISPFK